MSEHLIVRLDDGLVLDAVVGHLDPPPEGCECVERIGEEWIGWTWSGGEFSPPAPANVDLVAYAASRRWEIIESTRLDLGGFSVPTDKTTRDTLTAAYVKASASPLYQITDWKVGPGAYVTLTAPQIVAIADTVESFVQTMFTRNRQADEAIEAGTATTQAHVDAILAG